MKLLVAVLLGWGVCSIAGSAYAAEDCTRISDDTARLACYDAQYRPASVVSTASRWTVQREKSKIDDTENVYLASSSEDEIPGRFGGSARPALMIRCAENKTSLYMTFDGLFMADIQGYGEVTFRIDDRKAFTRTLDVSTDNQALGFWSGGQAVPMIKQLFGGSALLVRATPFNESAITFTLPIWGLEEAIVPLREACGW